jgi:hypothetical protein
VPHVEERLQAIALRDPVPEVRTRAADVLRRTGRLERLRGVIRGERPPGDTAS